MTVRFFSDKTRPIHMGPYPSELLARGEQPMLRGVPKQTQLTFTSDKPHSVINAMREHQAMLDAIRDGLINLGQSDIPSDIQERADHLKAFGFFYDAAAVGICRLSLIHI